MTRTDGEGRRSFLIDILGSTIALTDDSGAVVTEYTYDPFGATTATGAASSNAFQYTGRETDGATGLYYYRTRYYSPSLHRFISEDELEVDPWETNLYAYVGNNPVNFIDPTGHAAALLFPLLMASAAFGAAFLQYCQQQPSNCSAVGDTIVGAMVGLVAMLGILVAWFEAAVSYAKKAGEGSQGSAPPPGSGDQGKAGGSGNEAAPDSRPFKVPKPGVSGKEGSKDVPDWARGYRPFVGESGKKFAKRLMDGQYPGEKYPTRGKGEFQWIKKWGDRSFQDPK